MKAEPRRPFPSREPGANSLLQGEIPGRAQEEAAAVAAAQDRKRRRRRPENFQAGFPRGLLREEPGRAIDLDRLGVRKDKRRKPAIRRQSCQAPPLALRGQEAGPVARGQGQQASSKDSWGMRQMDRP